MLVPPRGSSTVGRHGAGPLSRARWELDAHGTGGFRSGSRGLARGRRGPRRRGRRSQPGSGCDAHQPSRHCRPGPKPPAPWKDPMVAVEYSNVPLSSPVLSAHAMSGLQLRVQQTLPARGASSLEGEVKSARVDAAGLAVEEAALQLRAAVGTTWWALARTRLLREVTEQHVQRTEELLTAVRSRYEVGAVGQHAVLRIEVLRDQLRDELAEFGPRRGRAHRDARARRGAHDRRAGDPPVHHSHAPARGRRLARGGRPTPSPRAQARGGCPGVRAVRGLRPRRCPPRAHAVGRLPAPHCRERALGRQRPCQHRRERSSARRQPQARGRRGVGPPRGRAGRPAPAPGDAGRRGRRHGRL